MPDPGRRKKIKTGHVPELQTLMKATLEIQIFGTGQNGCFPALTVAGREIQMPEKASEMETFLAHTSMALANDAVDNAFCQDRQLGVHGSGHPTLLDTLQLKFPPSDKAFIYFRAKR